MIESITCLYLLLLKNDTFSSDWKNMNFTLKDLFIESVKFSQKVSQNLLFVSIFLLWCASISGKINKSLALFFNYSHHVRQRLTDRAARGNQKIFDCAVFYNFVCFILPVLLSPILLSMCLLMWQIPLEEAAANQGSSWLW